MYVIGLLSLLWATAAFGQGPTTKIDLETQVKNVLAIVNGGTGSSSAAGARSNLGAVGLTDTQSLTNKTLVDPKVQISGCLDNQVIYVITASTGVVGCLSIPGGAPGTAKYIVQTADGALPNAQALSALSTGIVKVTTTTGVLSTAAAADLPAHASRHQNGGNDEVSTATPGANQIVKADSGGKLAAGWLPNSGVTPGTYGGANMALTVVADITGRITNLSSTTIAIAGTQITSGTIDPARILTGGPSNNKCVHVNGAGQLTVTSTDCGSGSGGITGPGVTTVGYLPAWADTVGGSLGTGLKVSTSGDASAVVETDSVGNVNATGGFIGNYVIAGGSGIGAGSFFQAGGSAVPTMHIRRSNSTPMASTILQIESEVGGVLSYFDWNGALVGQVLGNSTTANALAGTPTQCSSGNIIHGGIDTLGNAQGCGKINMATEITGIVPPGNLGSGTPTSSTCLHGDSTWGACTGGGSGTVTSVGLSLPAELTVTASPVTTAGTLTAIWATESANMIFGGPTGGGATAPTFRNLVAADIPNLDTSKLTTGILAIARGGTNQTSFTTNTCIRYNGTAFVSASGDCVIGPGSSTITSVPSWSNTSGTGLGTGYAVSSGSATANTLPIRDSNGASANRDLGETEYSVMAFGATGNGTTNDAVAIQNAIDTCGNGNGGVVRFPRGIFAIQSNLQVGDGGNSSNNTKRPCRLIGQGGGDFFGGNVAGYGTRIKWTGSAPGSPIFMMTFAGPYLNGGIENILFDANNTTNVMGIDLRQTQYWMGRNIGVWAHTSGPGLRFKPINNTNALNNGCRNHITGLWINGGGTGSEGILFDESPAGTFYDTCSTVLDTIVAYGTTYGMKVIAADNLYVSRAELHGSSGTPGSGGTCSLTFQQSTVNAAFPHENYFTALSPVGGVCGTTGTAQSNVLMPYLRGDCNGEGNAQRCEPYDNISSGTKLVVIDPGYNASSTPQAPSSIRGLNAIQHKPLTYAQLNANITCTGGTSNAEGTLAYITDATTNTWDAIVSAGGGSNHVMIKCDGTNWRVH